MTTRVLDEEFLMGLYRWIFDQISNPLDWKGPIDAEVPNQIAGLAALSVEFMTATKCDLYAAGRDHTRLISIGYRAGPAGP